MLEMIRDLHCCPPPWKGAVDGVIVSMGVTVYPAREIADWILSGGVPATAVGHDWFDPRVPAFYDEPRAIADRAAEHLLACGCASFLFVGFGRSTGSAARGAAFRAALARHRRRAAEHATAGQCYGTFEDELLVRADAKLAGHLRGLRKPLGVFALNDYFAAAVASLCRELGLAVPASVRVIGVGDTAAARANDPPLSSVRSRRDVCGFAAASALHRILRGGPVSSKPIAVPGAEAVPRVSTIGAEGAIGNLDDVLRHIDEHACAGVSVDQLVDIVGVSRRSFETWFRRDVGRSPAQEVRRVRLEKAKELLAASDLSVTRVAARVGFQDASAFSKFFRNGTGLSPRGFRGKRRPR
jgi:LacI family transcriptional regulator